jgi:hypothetical protein
MKVREVECRGRTEWSGDEVNKRVRRDYSD